MMTDPTRPVQIRFVRRAMREITESNAIEYLVDTGRLPPELCAPASARALGWGVSNVVLRVDVAGRPPIILKQSRERLRVRMLWESRLDRIWTERKSLELLASVLPEGTVPGVLFEDSENYLFAMTAAPDDSAVWKERLLAGDVDPSVGEEAGVILGAMHSRLKTHPDLDGFLKDVEVFDQLRIDPFYRAVARVHPDVVEAVGELIDETFASPDRTFVHADFSPKNILIHSRGLTAVDFETAHAGDPAFDLGFFLSHMLLKAERTGESRGPYVEVTKRFWDGYLRQAGPISDALRRRATRHVAACSLARVDGKSPVDYLDPARQAAVRRWSKALLFDPPSDWENVLSATGAS